MTKLESKNVAILAILIGIVALFYAISAVHMGHLV